MRLIKKKDIKLLEELEYKEASKPVDRFLNGEILPKYIFKSFFTESFTRSKILGVDDLSEEINKNIHRNYIDLEFFAIEIWSRFDRAARYKVLIEIITVDLDINKVEEKVKEIFQSEYNEKLATIILNYTYTNGDFTF